MAGTATGSERHSRLAPYLLVAPGILWLIVFFVVPLIALDQRATWYPDRFVAGGQVVEWWLNLATVAGWLLSSVFLLSFARLARNT